MAMLSCSFFAVQWSALTFSVTSLCSASYSADNFYKTENGEVRVEILLFQENLWLTQAKMAELLEVQKAAVSKRLKNIFESGELSSVLFQITAVHTPVFADLIVADVRQGKIRNEVIFLPTVSAAHLFKQGLHKAPAPFCVEFSGYTNFLLSYNSSRPFLVSSREQAQQMSTHLRFLTCWEFPKPFYFLPLNIPSGKRLLLHFAFHYIQRGILDFAKDLRRIFEKIFDICSLLLLFARPYILYHSRF